MDAEVEIEKTGVTPESAVPEIEIIVPDMEMEIQECSRNITSIRSLQERRRISQE